MTGQWETIYGTSHVIEGTPEDRAAYPTLGAGDRVVRLEGRRGDERIGCVFILSGDQRERDGEHLFRRYMRAGVRALDKAGIQ